MPESDKKCGHIHCCHFHMWPFNSRILSNKRWKMWVNPLKPPCLDWVWTAFRGHDQLLINQTAFLCHIKFPTVAFYSQSVDTPLWLQCWESICASAHPVHLSLLLVFAKSRFFSWSLFPLQRMSQHQNCIMSFWWKPSLSWPSACFCSVRSCCLSMIVFVNLECSRSLWFVNAVCEKWCSMSPVSSFHHDGI